MRPRAVVGTLLAALLALAALAPVSLAAGSDNKKSMWGPLTLSGVSEFPLYHELGVRIYQMGISWAEIAPTRPRRPTDPRDPAYHWTPDVAYALQHAARYRMRVLLQVNATPGWANGGRAPTYPPSRASDLAAFMTAAARKYPAIHLWMIWGEPNRTFGTLVPASPSARRLTAAQAAAPHQYAKMLDASYGALKAVSPTNLVIGGNTYTTGLVSTRQWIENLRLPDGRPPRMDLYGHNPFCFRAPDLSNPQSPQGEVDFSDLGRLSALVNSQLAAPHQKLKLFLSEWTIPTGPDDEFNIFVSPAVQAQWITDGLRIVRSSSFIYALGWIHVYDDPPGGSKGGLLDVNGNPKPGFYAFKNG